MKYLSLIGHKVAFYAMLHNMDFLLRDYLRKYGIKPFTQQADVSFHRSCFRLTFHMVLLACFMFNAIIIGFSNELTELYEIQGVILPLLSLLNNVCFSYLNTRCFYF